MPALPLFVALSLSVGHAVSTALHIFDPPHCVSSQHSLSGTVGIVCPSLGSDHFPGSGLPLGVATAISFSSDQLRSF